MILHVICLILLFTGGVHQGYKIYGQQDTGNDISTYKNFLKLTLFASGVFVLATLADTVSHLIQPDVCIFGIASCFFILMFYLVMAGSFVYVIENQFNFSIPKVWSGKFPNTHWLPPMLLVGMVISLRFYLNMHEYFYQLNENFPNLPHLEKWIGCYFYAGALAGYAFQRFSRTQDQRFASFKCFFSLLKWSTMIAIGAVFFFQVMLGVKFIFLSNAFRELKYALSLTLMIIAFHLLYLLCILPDHHSDPDAG